MGAKKDIESILHDLKDILGNETAEELYLGIKQASKQNLLDLRECFEILLQHSRYNNQCSQNI